MFDKAQPSAGFLLPVEWPLLAVISTGRCNTHLKPSCLVFRLEGFAGVIEGAFRDEHGEYPAGS
jgi:hypothetical protein